MTDTQPTLQAALSQELRTELKLTRRLLERVPTEQFGWQPHPKSMTIGALASHMANLVGFLELSLTGPDTDVTTVQMPQGENTDAVLSRFDVNSENIHKAIEQVDDATFHGSWSLRRGEQVLMTLPRAAVARTMVLNHLIHHRGQLSVYLRLLDIPVPAIYGSSADEGPQRG
ncbi:putative damage-inducible protein DinB [Hymenobacter luteus]|uniref:Damage-inducible protein DinB n=2 Tax=Hymenobacter TaxID=89966 RepID=A0ABR6JWP2_9BACT|nr:MULTISPECIES: DinB family protein [Hymenobacter]MBB4601239.1 putative damage-inducible protein DinB [Hymenobacter latericoloratus]MBB6058554.1 putative damage-inducible protein DinB [Hymenobacter luteus]